MAMISWQPFDTAPRDGEHFLVHGIVRHEHREYATPDETEISTVYFQKFGDDWQLLISNVEYADYCWEPTHWMPLPPPPVIAQ